jgi:YebC/PmpR family DNA-binding regulatory protein
LSGHSKWANIKRQKAVVDAKKGATYARTSREIIVAARLGGGDINHNFKLRQAVEKAKAEGVPNDNIARAIEKGMGGADSGNLEELTYEGYGPSGVAILVRCATDNRNRTAGDIRYYFSKHGGNLGETGCVGWLFQERGEIVVEKTNKLNEDDLLNSALLAGADDLDNSADDVIVIASPPVLVETVRNALSKDGFKVISAEATLSPKTIVEVTDKEAAKQLLKLIDQIENQDDVQQVYANYEMEQSWLTEFFS